ncbi:MAG: GyrI-like domain-containing protein [Propionibacteriaceae bacterium]|nr:GyrI-like domain-containing protein [Propionibacteriaceae bacterium]
MIDFKKTDKQFYQPSGVSVVDVPQMTFIAVDGHGDPSSSTEYVSAIEMLYTLSYAIKMTNKAVMEYVVPPLEGLWDIDQVGAAADESSLPVPHPDELLEGVFPTELDKSKFVWTMMIRQPDFVTESVLETARKGLAKKRVKLDTTPAHLITITEGLCVQAMHLGSYDDEPPTIAAMDEYATAHGFVPDFTNARRHHEIYLSDPRKTAPDKLKTVLRLPVSQGSVSG